MNSANMIRKAGRLPGIWNLSFWRRSLPASSSVHATLGIGPVSPDRGLRNPGARTGTNPTFLPATPAAAGHPAAPQSSADDVNSRMFFYTSTTETGITKISLRSPIGQLDREDRLSFTA